MKGCLGWKKKQVVAILQLLQSSVLKDHHLTSETFFVSSVVLWSSEHLIHLSGKYKKFCDTKKTLYTTDGLHSWCITMATLNLVYFMLLNIFSCVCFGFSTFISQVKSVWLPLADTLQDFLFYTPYGYLELKNTLYSVETGIHIDMS